MRIHRKKLYLHPSIPPKITNGTISPIQYIDVSLNEVFILSPILILASLHSHAVGVIYCVFPCLCGTILTKQAGVDV